MRTLVKMAAHTQAVKRVGNERNLAHLDKTENA